MAPKVCSYRQESHHPASLRQRRPSASSSPDRSTHKTDHVHQDTKSLKDLANDKLKTNPSALGDPVSLKAEKSDTEPTDEDRPGKSSDDKKKVRRLFLSHPLSLWHTLQTKEMDCSPSFTEQLQSLKELAQEKLDNGNASQLGDPVSLKAETADSHPTDQDAGAGTVDASKLHQAKTKAKL